MLIQIDFEKAFDYLEWHFIEKCLSYFNFGPSFKNWIKLFYTDIKSSVTNNGWTTEPFTINRGVRQGCPISPYIFILCVEILGNFIRNDDNVKGINLDTYEYNISQYADDTSFTLLANHNNVDPLFHILNEFQKI